MAGPILSLDASSYRRHAIHGSDRAWAETNCYADVLIELIHSIGFEPIAALPFTLTADFEVDQWTFFKFRHIDLWNLYGLEIQELNPWRDLAGHVEAQVAGGRHVLVEVDSFFLPDTQGTAYRKAHVKSTIAVNSIDVAAARMGYFHGQGYFEVGGDDFRNLFQLDGLVHERMLPPYIEIVKHHRTPASSDLPTLVAKSVEALRSQLEMMPVENPFPRFRHRFEEDLPWLSGQPIDTFHEYAFATLRQYGACFELAHTYLTWLGQHGEAAGEAARAEYRLISDEAKMLQFKLARSIARGKPLDLSPVDNMADAWARAREVLHAAWG